MRFEDFFKIICCLLLLIFLLNIPGCIYAQKAKKDAAFYYNSALKYEGNKKFKESIDQFLSAVRLSKQDSELQLKSIYKCAYYFNYADEADKPEIIKWASVGVRIVLQANRIDTLSADMLYRGGLAYRKKYLFDSAMLCYETAIKKYDYLYGKESTQAADCFMGMGNIYESFFYDFNKAESLYEKALTIREKIKPDEIATYMVATLYVYLVEVNRKQKDFEKALFYELKNIDFANSLMKNPLHREAAYEGLAITYADLGQHDKARSFYRKAIAFNQEVNKNTKNALLGYYYEKLGELDEKENAVSAAIVNHTKAVQIFSSLQNPKNPNYIRALLHLGQLYTMSDASKSLNYFRNALNLIKQDGLIKSGSAIELHSAIGDYFARLDQMDSAFLYYQFALKSASQAFNSRDYKSNPEKTDITLKDYAFEVLLKKAKALVQLFKSTHDLKYAESALRSYLLAEKLLSDSRMDLDIDHSKWDFFDSNFGLYEKVISLLLEMNQINPMDSLAGQAFYYMESSKSKMLSDALNKAEFVEPLISEDTLIQSLNKQKRNLHFLKDQLKKTEEVIAEDPTIITAIGDSMIAADRAIQKIEQKLNDKYPAYLSTKYRNHIRSLKELQKYAKDKKVSVIEYFWGADEVFAIGISNQDIKLKRIGSVDSVERELKKVLHFLKSEQNAYSQEAITSFGKTSFSLYKILLQPFQQLLKSSEHLIIIPDGLIGQLPFEVLATTYVKSERAGYQSLNYLVKTHFVSYSFSSSYLLKERMRLFGSPRLLAFGFTRKENVRSGDEDTNFSDIVGTEEEVKALAKKFPDGEYFFGSDVTEGKFKECAPLVDIIHLAIHGQGDTEQNYSASLSFRDSISDDYQDGKLNWYELFDMRLKARLAVISSCESGIGKTYRGEGMLSMASAFAYAGCSNIVMGLWKVNDQVSVTLMDTFYENIQNGENVDDALTYAKRAYLEQGDELSANPKMWASLVAYGNEKVITNDAFYLKYLFILTFISLFIFLIISFVRKKYRIANN